MGDSSLESQVELTDYDPTILKTKKHKFGTENHKK